MLPKNPKVYQYNLQKTCFMDSQYLISLFLFVLIVSITPGPNNLMVTASGSNFGYWRTLPHIAGIMLGFSLLLIAVAAGLGTLFIRFPLLQLLLKFIGACYLFWLAWKIATSAGLGKAAAANQRPISLVQALIFQWVNPKSWTMAITGISAFILEGPALLPSLILIIGTFAALTIFSTTVWTLLGEKIGRLLHSEAAHKRFNISLGALTALSVLSIMV